MMCPLFDEFFDGVAARHIMRAVKDALAEDGPDLTSNAVFAPDDKATATITAKEDTIVAGLPFIPLVLEETALQEPGEWSISHLAEDGSRVAKGQQVAVLEGGTRVLLRAERVILNFITHLSGIANLVSAYVSALEGTGVRLLDTRKTLPGLRYPEKYAVLVGGGHNHRKNLAELLMLKDNHIDAAGGITQAVLKLREAYADVTPIEVECRTLDEVREAVASGVNRIMLDNMTPTATKDGSLNAFEVARLREALGLVPESMEVEISGGITLENIGPIAHQSGPRKPDFISVGRLTHSAPAADFSMTIIQGSGLV